MTKAKHEHMLKDKLDLPPATRKRAAGALPDVPAPNLDRFVVTVDAPAAPTAADLEAAVANLLKAHAEATYRNPNEPIQPGDEVLVDLIGFSGGHVCTM